MPPPCVDTPKPLVPNTFKYRSGTLEAEVEQGDRVAFISTLHGG